MTLKPNRLKFGVTAPTEAGLATAAEAELTAVMGPRISRRASYSIRVIPWRGHDHLETISGNQLWTADVMARWA